MDILKYIISVLPLLLWGCSSDEMEDPSSGVKPSPVEFRAFVGEGSDAEFESGYFQEGNEIRIFCPVNYSTPDFTDNASGTYIYTYSETKDGDEFPYKFQAKEEGKGFDWQTLLPTSLYYVFEAMYFPGNKYFDEVPTDQNKEENFTKADMLIAHRRQPYTERGKAVKLTFHHAFAMVCLRVKIPVSPTPMDGPFLKDAIRDVYMRSMLTKYEVNYTQVINDHGLRTVRVPKEDEEADPNAEGLRKDVYLFLKEKSEIKTEQSEGKEIQYQEYEYRGIVPAQNFIDSGKDFILFKVNKNDGSNEPKTFRYVPETSNISLISSHVLNLSLEIKPELSDVVVLSAEIMPWGEASGDMEVGPAN